MRFPMAVVFLPLFFAASRFAMSLHKPYSWMAWVVIIVLSRECLAYIFDWQGGDYGGEGTVSMRNTVKTYVKEQYEDGKGRPVIVVNAPNSREATRPIRGITYPGAVSWHIIRTGNNEYTISLKDHDV